MDPHIDDEAAAAIDKFAWEERARWVLWHARFHDRLQWHNPRLNTYATLDRARAFVA